jgi:hypothetical protein
MDRHPIVYRPHYHIRWENKTSCHYTLSVDDGDLFNVEVEDQQPVTKSVTVDVSPIYPDCTGGHEFIVNTK